MIRTTIARRSAPAPLPKPLPPPEPTQAPLAVAAPLKGTKRRARMKKTK